jgi:hypothetical protein
VPFRSFTGLSLSERVKVISSLNESNSWGVSRFQDPSYLNQRLAVESRLYQEFVNLRGRPELQNPIYFFLGRNEKFEQHPLNRAYKIFLADLPENSVSFTYGDSMFGFDQGLRGQVGEKYQNPLCGRLFLKGQLSELFMNPNLPKRDPLPIEAQVWMIPPLDIVRLN